MRRSIGFDFGTTNSAIAVADDHGNVSLARFPFREDFVDIFRSILFFEREEDAAGDPGNGVLRRGLLAHAGPDAIERYLTSEGTGRLVQSLKSWLADRRFESTNIFGRMTTLSELISFLARGIRVRAEAALGSLGERVVVGRPVHFVGGEGENDDAFAEARLRAALANAGFEDVVFEYEPVAAAYFYESRLDHDERVLVADFGGGTSDFTLIEVGPRARTEGARGILANDGVGLAGDALDARILHHVVAPALGMGTRYRSMLDKELETPVWLYARLRKWHHLSFLKSKRTLDLLHEIADCADEPEKIRALLHVIENDLGYHLYRTIERAKVELSSSPFARLVLDDPPLRLDATIARSDFEQCIAEELEAIGACVDRCLAHAGIVARDVDRVFLTGGTSLTPAVREIFASRFGRERLAGGSELVSVASGLALRARQLPQNV